MLKINNLTIKYKSTILEDVSVAFPRGAVTVVKGASGSGKSSLLNILGLIQKPNKECSYYLDSKRIDFNSEQNKSDFRLKKVGFVFQQNNLVQELTAIENIMVPMRMLSKDEELIRKKAEDLIKYIGLNCVVDSYPSSLSGGEEQRVAIARALINDADIILADEPTASLDPKNANTILQLFKRLAHELNKIVIIVSHDEKIEEIADVVYEIDNLKLNMTRNWDTIPHANNNVKIEGKKNIYSFMKYYRKKRKSEKKLEKILIAVTAVIAAISTLFINFGDSFTNQQKDFINAISEKSIFVINDTLGLNSQTDYEDALRLRDEQIKNIKDIPNVNKVYPYYEFASYGLTEKKEGKVKNITDQAEISVMDGTQTIKKMTYNNTFIFSSQEPQFRIAPMYPEEELGSLIENNYDSTRSRDGFVLTRSFAKQLSDTPSSLVGKTLEIKCFVPIKLFDSKATKPQGPNHSKNEEIVQTDGTINKLITIKKEVTGILPDSYSYQRSEEIQNIVLVDYNEMERILSDNKDSNYKETYPGFPEKELGPSALMVYATSFEDIPVVKSKIENISPSFYVISKVLDIHKIQENLRIVKYIMRGVSLTLIIIVIVMFYFVYYFRNRTRKKEIGILKAIGLTKRDIFILIGYEMLIVAIKTFIYSLIIAVTLMFLVNGVLGLNNIFVISVSSIIFSFFLSFFIVIISGISSIWRTSRIDIIDVIRNNK